MKRELEPYNPEWKDGNDLFLEAEEKKAVICNNRRKSDYEITCTSKAEYPQLIQVWEASVRATHHFLKEEDILFFKKQIFEHYFDAVQLYVVRNDKNEISGFLGTSEDSIEMLFIHPDARGKGIGSALLSYAVNELHLHKVDVNEQNGQATGFYLHNGFSVVGRSESDSTGKPYPILHLKVKP